jgi:hypothetical protein
VGRSRLHNVPDVVSRAADFEPLKVVSPLDVITVLGCYHPSGNVLGAQQLVGCGSERPETEPRKFISGEIPIAAIDPLRSDALGVKARREKVAREPSRPALATPYRGP